MGGWGCPHEHQGLCHKVENRPCEPGMKGCVLAGRFVFSDAHKNTQRVLRDKLGHRQPRPSGNQQKPDPD